MGQDVPVCRAPGFVTGPPASSEGSTFRQFCLRYGVVGNLFLGAGVLVPPATLLVGAMAAGLPGAAAGAALGVGVFSMLANRVTVLGNTGLRQALARRLEVDDPDAEFIGLCRPENNTVQGKLLTLRLETDDNVGFLSLEPEDSAHPGRGGRASYRPRGDPRGDDRAIRRAALPALDRRAPLRRRRAAFAAAVLAPGPQPAAGAQGHAGAFRPRGRSVHRARGPAARRGAMERPGGSGPAERAVDVVQACCCAPASASAAAAGEPPVARHGRPLGQVSSPDLVFRTV